MINYNFGFLFKKFLVLLLTFFIKYSLFPLLFMLCFGWTKILKTIVGFSVTLDQFSNSQMECFNTPTFLLSVYYLFCHWLQGTIYPPFSSGNLSNVGVAHLYRLLRPFIIDIIMLCDWWIIKEIRILQLLFHCKLIYICSWISWIVIYYFWHTNCCIKVPK